MEAKVNLDKELREEHLAIEETRNLSSQNGNVGFEGKVLTLPQWCAFLLPRVMADK